jgi:hypothetical protein
MAKPDEAGGREQLACLGWRNGTVVPGPVDGGTGEEPNCFRGRGFCSLERHSPHAPQPHRRDSAARSRRACPRARGHPHVSGKGEPHTVEMANLLKVSPDTT